MKQRIYNYTAIFEPDMERGGYVVKVPALPGCVTQGDTLDDAQRNAREAISLYVEYLRDTKKIRVFMVLCGHPHNRATKGRSK